MKKFIFSSIFFVSLSFTAVSQAPQVNVVWGKLIKSGDANYDFTIGTDNEYFYTFGFEGKGFGIFQASNKDAVVKKYQKDNFRLVNSTIVEVFEYKGKDAVFESAKLVDGEIHLYYQVYNPKEDKKYLLLKKIDANGKLGNVEEIASGNSHRKSEGGFTLATSPDSTKLLVYIDLPHEKKENEKFNLKVFDRNQELLWEKNVELPYSDKHFVSGTKSIANNGDVYLIAFATPDKDKGEKKIRQQSNQSYKLFRITPTEDLLEFDLGLEEKYVNSASIETDFANNNMAISGFYSEKDIDDIGGSFFITIGQDDLKIKSASIKPFTKEFLKNFMSERRAEKGKELTNYVFRDIIKKDDGGAVIIAEQHTVHVSTSYSPQTGYTYTTYYTYNDIIAISIMANGEISWTAHIPKLQTSSNDGGFYLSYYFMQDGSNLHFIFNDNRKNLDKRASNEKIKSVGNIKKSVSILATLDANGNVSYDELFHNKDFSAILVPKLCTYNLEDKSAIIYGKKGKKTRFGRLQFQ